MSVGREARIKNSQVIALEELRKSVDLFVEVTRSSDNFLLISYSSRLKAIFEEMSSELLLDSDST
jgi:hypothetical protein